MKVLSFKGIPWAWKYLSKNVWPRLTQVVTVDGKGSQRLLIVNELHGELSCFLFSPCLAAAAWLVLAYCAGKELLGNCPDLPRTQQPWQRQPVTVTGRVGLANHDAESLFPDILFDLWMVMLSRRRIWIIRQNPDPKIIKNTSRKGSWGFGKMTLKKNSSG